MLLDKLDDLLFLLGRGSVNDHCSCALESHIEFFKGSLIRGEHQGKNTSVNKQLYLLFTSALSSLAKLEDLLDYGLYVPHFVIDLVKHKLFFI